MTWTESPATGESRRQQQLPMPAATAPLLDSTPASERVDEVTARPRHCGYLRPGFNADVSPSMVIQRPSDKAQAQHAIRLQRVLGG
jgi:hypothetical protein